MYEVKAILKIVTYIPVPSVKPKRTQFSEAGEGAGCVNIAFQMHNIYVIKIYCHRLLLVKHIFRNFVMAVFMRPFFLFC